LLGHTRIERLNLVGLATEAEFGCPISKSLLTDALGLTDIQFNRVLRQLSDNDTLAGRAINRRVEFRRLD
jgi:hypothetical protein